MDMASLRSLVTVGLARYSIGINCLIPPSRAEASLAKALLSYLAPGNLRGGKVCKKGLETLCFLQVDPYDFAFDLIGVVDLVHDEYRVVVRVGSEVRGDAEPRE